MKRTIAAVVAVSALATFGVYFKRVAKIVPRAPHLQNPAADNLHSANLAPAAPAEEPTQPIEKYLWLRHKPLRSADYQRKIEALLFDRQNLSTAFASLTPETETSIHLSAVAFLSDALANAVNPHRAWLQSELEKFVLSSVAGRNITADKVDLFAHLAALNRPRAEALAAAQLRSGGTNAMVMNYALNFAVTHKL